MNQPRVIVDIAFRLGGPATRGLDVEVLTRAALESAAREATEPADREHVARYVWRQPERFRLGSVTAHDDHSHLRWTVYTLEDVQLAQYVYRDLLPWNPAFALSDVLDRARRHPALHTVNSHVRQKAT